MSGYKLGSLNLAQQLVSVSANAVILYLCYLNESFRIYKERSAVSHALIFLHHTKAAAEHACGVGKHRVLYFLDAVGGVMPCLVHEVAVCAYREHLYAKLFQTVVFLCQVNQLSRAHESEVGWIEEEKSPLAFQVFTAYCLELSVLECLHLELRHLCVDY